MRRLSAQQQQQQQPQQQQQQPSAAKDNTAYVRLHSKPMRLQGLAMLLVVVSLLYLAPSVAAFQLSMVASRMPFTDRNIPSSSPLTSSTTTATTTVSPSRTWGKPPAPSSVVTTTNPSQLSSSLISQLAEVALKFRLADHTGVKFDVTANPTDLILRGRIGPVTVQGRGWRSKLGLSCRAIEATVDSCDLDVGRILSQQKLRLTTPARGKAMVALNSADFANFITHPLMKPPRLSSQTSSLQFLKDGVEVDPAQGTVTFYASLNQQDVWKFSLRRGPTTTASGSCRAVVTAQPITMTSLNTNVAEVGQELANSVSHFFNTMVFELDGTFLCFRDMMITSANKSGGESPLVMLSLNIVVKKFPSRGLDF